MVDTRDLAAVASAALTEDGHAGENYRRSGTDGYASVVTDTVSRITGRPPRTLGALLAEQSG